MAAVAAANLDESFVRFFSSARSDMHNESFALEASTLEDRRKCSVSMLCRRMHRRRQKEDINLPVESAGAARAAAPAPAPPAVGCAVAPLSRPSSSTLV
ncbi:hypothetical protein M0802_008083 [Mischocyttarus mexicanus]|nr:hypothetical protein M0802_008083 [Mischocyttarus mexicanus]